MRSVSSLTPQQAGDSFRSSTLSQRNGPSILTPRAIQQRPHPYNNQGYLPNGAVAAHLPPGAAPLLPNNGRIIQTGGVRVLCVADVRGTS
jgi:hypothetical protein